MDTRTLGTPGLQVSALGLGCMGMSKAFGPRPPRDEMITFLRAAVDRGVTLFDTAEVYGVVEQEAAPGVGSPRGGPILAALPHGSCTEAE